MSNINHKIFKEKLYQFTNKIFDVVSTIDHPFASPPIRLVDGHNNLKKISDSGTRPLICIWDANFPDIDRYRYELIFDIGILSGRDKKFFIFSDKILYPLQRPILIDFIELRKRLHLVLEKSQDLPREKKGARNRRYIKNFDKIVAIYNTVIQISNDGTEFYQNFLKEIYKLLGLNDLALLLDKTFQPYLKSPLIQKWIPYCIKRTMKEPFGLLSLLEKGLFKQPCFRSVDLNEKNKFLRPIDIKSNMDIILEEVANNKTVPSREIFFWTLFLADIKHFGNDYGFFQKIDNVLGRPKNILQITEHHKDSQYIIQFAEDISFNYLLKKKSSPLKNSRIASITALYIQLGETLSTLIKNIFEGKISQPQIVKMGE